MVEFALVLPVLLAFLLGIVTVGVSYNRNISMNNAARESARYGAVRTVDGNMSAWLSSVADVAVTSASGDMDAIVDGQYVCVAFVYPAGSFSDDRTVRLVEVNGVRTETVGSQCFSDSRPSDERRVQIELRRESELNALIYAETLTLDSSAVARYERVAR